MLASLLGSLLDLGIVISSPVGSRLWTGVCGEGYGGYYMIHVSGLCTMISCILRERFGLHVSPEYQKPILSQADQTLATWSLRLPDTLPRISIRGQPCSSELQQLPHSSVSTVFTSIGILGGL